MFPLSMGVKMELIQDRAVKKGEQRWMTLSRIWITQTGKMQDTVGIFCVWKEKTARHLLSSPVCVPSIALSSRIDFFFLLLPVPILCCWQTVSLTKMSTFKQHVHQTGRNVPPKFSISWIKFPFNNHNSSQLIENNLICLFFLHSV